MTSAGGAQGGLGLVIQDQPQSWYIELMLLHRHNVMFCKIVTDGKQTMLINTYLPSTLEHLPYLEESLT